ncbi:uncharacterized protein LOC141649886 [Silene latifolia]|uniref:uncharacterized protein LOC141649886 n=1 Tax=Silene latifolia TaxID=37657 RepID=UPI003D772237
MVEVEIDQEFLSRIVFEDELGTGVKVALECDWLPITCQKCKGIGHKTANCRGRAIEFPPLAPTVRTSPQITTPAAPVPSTPSITPAQIPHGSIFTPARVITKVTRHESRVVDRKKGEFSINFNAELAEASGVAEMKDVKWFLHQNDVDLFGLLETRVKPGSLNRVASQVCYNWNYSTNTIMHPGGRIWILWKNDKVDIEVLEMGAQYMHINVKDLNTDQCFRATFIYAFNKVEETTSLWQALIRLNVSSPWIVLGDFNNVMHANERLGKMVKDDEMVPFQSTVNSCDLHDMKSTGSFFTWNNKQPSAT